MDKKLNIKRIAAAMDTFGLNQAGLSKKLEVSRTIVSAWFKGDKFPRPDKLLKLGITLSLSFQDLVEKTVTDNEPIVAFRKKATRKTKDIHLAQAKETGQLLELLALQRYLNIFINKKLPFPMRLIRSVVFLLNPCHQSNQALRTKKSHWQ
ncbi:MAG: helix-turn-helix domain-containing protein, partial [Proteobacteria bacterium]|nr:helix-turn-helix domain-containing protein [Pseudomonadota bacterium]